MPMMYKVSSSSVGSKGRANSRTEIQTMGEVEEVKVEGVVVTAVSIAVALCGHQWMLVEKRQIDERGKVISTYLHHNGQLGEPRPHLLRSTVLHQTRSRDLCYIRVLSTDTLMM
jgi:hypothetical protein